MSKFIRRTVPALLLALALTSATPARADNYTIDPAHSSVFFKISHLGLSWVYGLFREFSGSFILDANDPSKSSFSLSVKAETVDTNNKVRDNHLRSPDFFDVKQSPVILFKSTSVKAAKDGFDVTGDLTLHGVTKPITFRLVGGRTAEFPTGVQRTGYSTELVFKRSAYGMEKGGQAVGDEVHVAISFEGTKK